MAEETVVVSEADRMTKVGAAIDVFRRAATEEDRDRRIAIIREALEVSQDCVEAWLALAQEFGDSLEQVRDYLQEAVKAGERLFANHLDEWKGKFWNVAQTRPYMQARMGLGQVLWELGERSAAVGLLKGTIELNPMDHQNVRYVLLKAYADLKQYDDALQLIEQYSEEQSTVMAYGKLLAAFAVYGDSLMARSAFLAARKQNAHVMDYILGLRQMPQKLPKTAQAGDEAEAIRYVAVFYDDFEEVDGIDDFLRAQKKRRGKKEQE